ncbi:transglutaminase-like cysteine peptidase [Bradyrhizobium sp. TZ2]
MGLSVYSRALRAGIVACGLAWFAPADLRAETPGGSGSTELVQRSAEPFGLPASSLTGGGLRDKWLGVQRRLDDEMVQLALCEGDREGCVSPAALKFLGIVDAAMLREGRARLGEVNRAINLAIRPMGDLAQHGRIDVWTSPLATLARGGGDCEDYAIAKFVALRRAGIAPDDIRIVVLHDTIHGEDHAVAAARLDGRWLTLDNRRMAMVEDSDVRNYRPTFVIDQHRVMRYADAPLLADASSRPAAPVVVSSLATSGLATFATPGL